MRELPLRSLFVSDYRRIEGHRTVQLDAPIVLLHGGNGAGKTSALSALELALTGQVRSLRRQDPRYTAYIPFHGCEFATVSAEVSRDLDQRRFPSPITVGGRRIDGQPALASEPARFFAERCYLDQFSLARLLDLYEKSEGHTESALARFVNELLGLEALDALREGLRDANDWRRLRRLSPALVETESKIKNSHSESERLQRQIDSTRSDIANIWEALKDAASTLRPFGQQDLDPDAPADELRKALQDFLQDLNSTSLLEEASLVAQGLVRLNALMRSLEARPSAAALEEAKTALAEARREHDRWKANYQDAIEKWCRDADQVGISFDQRSRIGEEIDRVTSRMRQHRGAAQTTAELETEMARIHSRLEDLGENIAETSERVGSLAEGLTALRASIDSEVCPVCDRDFSEVSETKLDVHLDLKLSAISAESETLRQQMRERRDCLLALERCRSEIASVAPRLLDDALLAEQEERRRQLSTLQRALKEIEPAVSSEDDLLRRIKRLTEEIADMKSFAAELDSVEADLQISADTLGVVRIEDDPLVTQWEQLLQIAVEKHAEMAELDEASAKTGKLLGDLRDREERLGELREQLADAAEQRTVLGARISAVQQHQAISKKVYRASSRARAAIVERVFTESLNEVWRSVFSRLAPYERFFPSFGIPTTSRKGLDLQLQTVHASGTTAGAPQMMLSAGNLNTAALSLFVALHFAVKPLVRCLVFDDPVQSMDEVHVAQFAGLIRVIARQHDRQVVVAVHERALFEYLALELSPAYQGDELITLQLGDAGESWTWHRHSWEPDRLAAL